MALHHQTTGKPALAARSTVITDTRPTTRLVALCQSHKPFLLIAVSLSGASNSTVPRRDWVRILLFTGLGQALPASWGVKWLRNTVKKPDCMASTRPLWRIACSFCQACRSRLSSASCIHLSCRPFCRPLNLFTFHKITPHYGGHRFRTSSPTNLRHRYG